MYREPYWYYTEVLEEKEKVIFLRVFSFSEKATEETSGRESSLDVTAEAIQSANFRPDFLSKMPWEDQTAEVCIHVKDGTEQEKERYYQNLSLKMEGRAGELVAVPGDFFVNLSELMPETDNLIVWKYIINLQKVQSYFSARKTVRR